MDTPLDATIRNILQRPGMYLGEPSVIRLRSFLDGYIHALCESTTDKSCLSQIQSFRDWVYSKYAVAESLGWEQVLISEAGNDRLAFALFEQLWDEFGRGQDRAANKAVNERTGNDL